MKYPGWANIICFDQEVGNALAAKIDPDGGANTFARNALRWSNSNGGGAVVAYAASVPLTEKGLAMFAEFYGLRPVEGLAAAGITAEQIDAGQNVLLIEYGEREKHEGRLLELIADAGLELVNE